MPKRRMEVLKSWEEFYARVRIAEANEALKLEMLVQFNPNNSDRQIVNRSLTTLCGRPLSVRRK
jgi:hypothetical protein